jgi:hypothetical protein
VAPRAVHTEGSTVVAADTVASLLPIVSGQAPIVARGPSAQRLTTGIASRSTPMPMNDCRKKFFLPTLGLSSRVRPAPSSEGSAIQDDLVAVPGFSIGRETAVTSPAWFVVALIARGVCPQQPSGMSCAHSATSIEARAAASTCDPPRTTRSHPDVLIVMATLNTSHRGRAPAAPQETTGWGRPRSSAVVPGMPLERARWRRLRSTLWST